MKAFVIFSSESPSKSGTLVSVISAFARIDSIGLADNLVEAVDLIRQRYPDSLIFDNRLFEEGQRGYLLSVLENKGSFILLPVNRHFRDKCTYIGIDLSGVDQKEWLLKEVSRTLLEYQPFAAE